MIDSLTISAPAKLNLFLHLQRKLSSGYHELQSFIIFINLFDKITIKKNSNNNNFLEITGPLANFLNIDQEDNLIIKVSNHIKKQFNIKDGLSIILEKHIPVAAGLAGGSTDAAAILKCLNIFYNLKLTNDQLTKIAAKFGADIPSCVYSKSGMIEGIGEKFTNIPVNFFLPILMISPLISVSTKEVYQKTNILNNNHQININSLKELLAKNNRTSFLEFLIRQNNDLTRAATSLLPEITNILDSLQKTNCILSRLTGSGGTCFAIYNSEKELQKATSQVRKLYPNYFITTTSNLIV